MLVTVSGILRDDSKEQPLKAPSEILVIVFGSVIEVIYLQLEKPKAVSPPVIVIVFKEYGIYAVPPKADEMLIQNGSVMLTTDEQSSNTPFPMLETLFGICIFVSEEHP